ncbi:MAG TPA: alpha/beta hydrolase [Kofleriaceae bacterium]|nr:alpha/beta hydrolase [Kofleriaceae bacterium]
MPLFIDDQGAGEPVVLLHSGGLSGRQWRRLASDLVAHGKRAMAVDLTGHGRSEPWPEPTPFSFRIDVDRIVDILRDVGPAHLVGHSYGGLLALQTALAAPTQVRSLSVYDPVAFGVLGEADADARQVIDGLDLSWRTGEMDHEQWLHTFVDFWGGAGSWNALRDDMRAEFRRVVWVVREAVRSLADDVTPASAYASFRFPVQLVTGELSPLPARRVGQRIAEAIPGARFDTVPGVGHLAPLTNAAAVNAVLWRW